MKNSLSCNVYMKKHHLQNVVHTIIKNEIFTSRIQANCELVLIEMIGSQLREIRFWDPYILHMLVTIVKTVI